MATGTLTGKYERADGSPQRGTIYITPSVPVVRDAAGNVILSGGVSVKLDDQGAFSVSLAATDNLTLDPSGVTYKVTLRGLPPVTGVAIPSGGTVDMADVTPVDPAAPTYAAWAFNTGGGGGGGAVASVNAKTGAVVLNAADVGADAAGAAATVQSYAIDRSHHTGSQTSATISDLVEAVQDIVAASLVGSGVTVTYNDAAGTVTLAAAAGTDLEAVRDAIGVALVGVGNIGVAVNDATDTITISTTATVNSTDAALRDRSTHTGTQSADTLTDGTTNKAFLATERTKLTGIATGATANATDAQLRDRSTHTGTQAVSTVTGLQTALDGKLPAAKNTIVFMGDSITSQSVVTYAPGNVDYTSYGFLTWAQARLGQRLQILAPSGSYTSGIGGNTTAQMVSRFTTDVLNLSPGWVHILGGTNDIAGVGGGSATTAMTNLATMYDAAATAGIRVIAGTIPPKATALLTDTQRRDAERLNNWIRSQPMTRRGFIVVDYHQALSGANGDYRIPFATSTAYSADGTHPSAGGAMRMGQVLADALEPVVPKLQQLPTSNYDDDLTSATAENVVGAFTMLAGTGGTLANSAAGTVATGWGVAAITGSASGYTASKVVRDTCPGEWQQLVSASSTQEVKFFRDMTFPGDVALAAGETVQGWCEIETENVSALSYMNLTVIFTDSTAGYAVRAGARTSSWLSAEYTADPNFLPPCGVYKTPPIVVPANANLVSMNFEFRGAGTFRIGRPTLRRS